IRGPLVSGVVAGAVAGLLITFAAAGRLDRTGAFFGAGTLFLIACVCLLVWRPRRAVRRGVARPRRGAGGGGGVSPLHGRAWRLGFRNAAERPGRSVLAIAVVASAIFILISVDAFRREGTTPRDRHSGVGGYGLIVDLLLPLVHDPNGQDGREELGLHAGDN